MPTVVRQEVRRGKLKNVTRTPTVRNKVIVNADSEDEAARKGLKYFRYTSRDAYAIDTVNEISPGKWQVTALVRNPTKSDAKKPFKPEVTTKTTEDVREPYVQPEDETDE